MLRIFSTVRVPLTQAPRSSPVRFASISPSAARRRRKRRLEIDSPEDPLPVFSKMSRESVYAKPGEKKRGLPKDSPEIRNSKTLAWILRHGARLEGISMRPDGYVEVGHLLQNRRMRDLNILALENIVKTDPKNRYSLICESGVWLIRANQGHSLKTVQMELQPITSASEIPLAVHGTTRKAWESISTQGLSKMTRNHIHLAQGIGSETVISGMRKSSQILIHIDVQKAIDHGLTFYLSTNGVILSEGDENGFIAPAYFKRVENSNRMALPGWEGPAAEFHNVLAEGLSPATVEITEGGGGVEGVQASSAAEMSKDGPSELVDELQNVKLT